MTAGRRELHKAEDWRSMLAPKGEKFGESRIGLDLGFCNPLKLPKPPISLEPSSLERQIGAR